MMEFEKTVDVLDYIRAHITSDEKLCFTENKVFTPSFGKQAQIIENFSILINLNNEKLLNDIYKFFEDKPGYLIIVDWNYKEGDCVVVDPELAMIAIFGYLYDEWDIEA